jgi:uncharacterized protein (DUF1330 family)
MISMIKVKEPAKLQEYLPKVSKIGSSYGAEMVFVGPATGAITGALDHQMVVVVRFPTVEDIDALFASDAYQPLIPLREEAAEMTIIKYQEKS